MAKINIHAELHTQQLYPGKAVVLGPRLRGFIFWSRVMIGSLTQYRDITRNSCPDCMRVCYSMKLILDE